MYESVSAGVKGSKSGLGFVFGLRVSRNYAYAPLSCPDFSWTKGTAALMAFSLGGGACRGCDSQPTVIMGTNEGTLVHNMERFYPPSG